MQDRELYFYLLGLKSPWMVGNVKLAQKARRVEVMVNHPQGQKWVCPECSKECGLYDHAEERRWRHLDSCHFQT